MLVWLGPTNKIVDSTDMMGMTDMSSHLNQTADRAAELEYMCTRSYWGRLWIFQELKWAREVILVCGNISMPWERFKRKLMQHGKNDISFDGTKDEDDDNIGDLVVWKLSNTVRSSPATRMVTLCSQRTPTSLWNLLQVTANLQCYDQRDRVYAILGMAKSGATGIDATYAMPLPRLMHLVLSNLHSSIPLQSVRQLSIQCERPKSLMGLGSDFPWCVDNYLATETVAQMSTAFTPTA